MKDRKEKTELLKALLNGSITLAQLKQPIKYERLSVNELYLLLTLMEASKAGDVKNEEAAACIDYYRIISSARKPGESCIKRDDEKVTEWYNNLNLQIKHPLK